MNPIQKKLEAANHYVTIALLFILQAAVFLPMVYFRLVDGDEGYYLLAAKLVLEGKTLYSDFFYPQMPLLPYVYGGWMKLFGTSWYAARTLSGIFAIALGFLLYFHVLRLTQKRSFGLLALALYLGSSFSIGWYTVVKTYAFSTLLLFGAYAALHSARFPRGKYFACGLLLGLAADTRLYFIGIIPVVLIYIFWYEKQLENRAGRLLWFAAGLALALLPNLFFIAKDFDNYIFNNLGYHAIRENHGPLWAVGQKIGTVLKLAGLYKPEGGVGAQFLILLLLNSCVFLSDWSTGKRLSFPFYFTASLFVLLLLPTPAYTQYFAGLLPFLILNAVALSRKIEGGSVAEKESQRHRGLRNWLLLLLVPYFLAWPLEYFRYTFWGKDVSGIGASSEAVNWRLSTIKSVTNAIDKYAGQSGLPVITLWPGYLLESKASILPGMENHFAMDVSDTLTEKERNRFHIVTPEEVYDHIRKHTASVVVLGNWTWEPVKTKARRLLPEYDYHPVDSIGTTDIYRWKAKTSPADRK